MRYIRENGVFFTVLFAYLVTFISVTYTFFQLYKLNEREYINAAFSRYTVISQIFREHLQNKTALALFEANLAVYNIDTIHNTHDKELIVKHARVLKKEGYKEYSTLFGYRKNIFYSRHNVTDVDVTMLELNKKIYFHIVALNDNYMLEDRTLKSFNPYKLYYGYIFIMGFILVAFLMIFSRIAPLRRLRKKIAAYGEGDMNINFKSRRHDEIALVANELDTAQSKINAMIESRTLFLRNIMHELKTPIAKGRIASAMIDSPKQRARFNSIFERLESLISEFAFIEEITSGHEHIELKEYRLIDLVDGAIDMAMSDEQSVSVAIDASYKIEADYKLFATAIKNMIDNANKYATDHKLKIYANENEIVFESKGEKLKKPLKFYVEPFTKENPSKNSFGLGLYLVDAILRSHNMVLAYEHEDGINRFIFEKL